MTDPLLICIKMHSSPSSDHAGSLVFKGSVNNDPTRAEVPTTITLYVPERDPYLPLRAFTCFTEEFVSFISAALVTLAFRGHSGMFT